MRSLRPTAKSSSNTPACASSCSAGVLCMPNAANRKPDARKPTRGGKPMRETASPSSNAPTIQRPIIEPPRGKYTEVRRRVLVFDAGMDARGRETQQQFPRSASPEPHLSQVGWRGRQSRHFGACMDRLQAWGAQLLDVFKDTVESIV